MVENRYVGMKSRGVCDDATGFIRLNALRLKVAAKVQRKK
jgi:argininosuccinate synthase